MTLSNADYETADLSEQICQDLIWWKNPQEVEDSELLRLILNLGTWAIWVLPKGSIRCGESEEEYALNEFRVEGFRSLMLPA